MSHAERENLSALADGELSRDQIRFMLRRTDGSAVLRATWSRYHIIRDGIRREMPVLADDDFAEKVMRQIGEAATTVAVPDRHRHGRSHHWLRWSAGGAIAAGVAAAALIIVQPQMRTEPVSGPATAQVAATHSAAPAARPMAAPTVPRWLSASPSAAQLAQPAAANFYAGPGRVAEPRGYAQHLSPYMALPGSPAPTTREARQVMHQLWSMTPRDEPHQRPMLRVQAQ